MAKTTASLLLIAVALVSMGCSTCCDYYFDLSGTRNERPLRTRADGITPAKTRVVYVPDAEGRFEINTLSDGREALAITCEPYEIDEEYDENRAACLRKSSRACDRLTFYRTFALMSERAVWASTTDYRMFVRCLAEDEVWELQGKLSLQAVP